jgi:hypothetical protein
VTALVSEERYFRWCSPLELRRFNDAHRISLGHRAMSGAGQVYRDGHVASRFAQCREADRVRLLEPRFGQATPDFAIRFGQTEQRFEITEADRPGRRRTKEYRTELPATETRLLEDDEWTTAIEYKAVIEARVLNKSSKQYDQCHGIIIWSNAFGITDDEVITPLWWSEACATGWRSFQEIWVHHRDTFLQVMQA